MDSVRNTMLHLDELHERLKLCNLFRAATAVTAWKRKRGLVGEERTINVLR